MSSVADKNEASIDSLPYPQVLDTAEAVDCLSETIESAGLLAVCWIPILYDVVSDIKDDIEYFNDHFTIC